MNRNFTWEMRDGILTLVFPNAPTGELRYRPATETEVALIERFKFVTLRDDPREAASCRNRDIPAMSYDRESPKCCCGDYRNCRRDCVPRWLELEREVAELREALGSLQEMLAKQIVGTETGAVCAACGESSKYGEPEHEERCPVARGLAIIEAALKPHAQGTF